MTAGMNKAGAPINASTEITGFHIGTDKAASVTYPA
jgi:hypothetical protein